MISSPIKDGEEEKITISCTGKIITTGRYHAILNVSYTGDAGIQRNSYGKLIAQIE